MRGHRRSVAHRRRPMRRRALVFCFKVALVFAGVTSFAYALTGYLRESPRFQVGEIQVDGNEVLSRDDILRTAGLCEARNLLRFDPAEVSRSIEALPRVKRCSVRRACPDLVHVEVEERVAVALLLADSHAYEIDEEGVVLSSLPSLSPHGAPMITNVPDLGVVQCGQQLSQAELMKALEVWGAFRGTEACAALRLSEISAPSVEHISMFCEEIPYEIRWGRSEIAQQARYFDVLWGQKDGCLPCEQYLDLRFGNNLVCR